MVNGPLLWGEGGERSEPDEGFLPIEPRNFRIRDEFARGESTPSRTKRHTLEAYWLFHIGSTGRGTSAGQPGTALPGSSIVYPIAS